MELVEKLGKFLTDTNHANRAKGTWILSNVLANLPYDFLNETQLNFICTFYIDRMKDHHEVGVNEFKLYIKAF